MDRPCERSREGDTIQGARSLIRHRNVKDIRNGNGRDWLRGQAAILHAVLQGLANSVFDDSDSFIREWDLL